MILIVAPYSPIGLSANPHLGAARKIETVIEALAKVDNDIVLVNSAHNKPNMRQKIESVNIAGTTLRCLSVKTYTSSKLGKLMSLKDVGDVVDSCLELGGANLVWIYNGYAFENLFCLNINKKINTPVILEFEDWHFSRSRGLNPKPYIDYILWRLNIKNINFSFGVNDNLTNKMSDYGVESSLLLGVVPEKLLELCNGIDSEPFANDIIRVGYFGGLSNEKGVDVLIEVLKRIPTGYKFIVSGAGALEMELQRLANKYSEKLEFHGRVSEAKLYQLISSVDVILNPHSPISDMAGGVFPFKVVEAIASEKLLISTHLPSANVSNLLDGVEFYDGSAQGLSTAIENSASIYDVKKKKIIRASLVAREAFSMDAILKPVKTFLKYHENT